MIETGNERWFGFSGSKGIRTMEVLGFSKVLKKILLFVSRWGIYRCEFA